jgi:hypothetical protein
MLWRTLKYTMRITQEIVVEPFARPMHAMSGLTLQPAEFEIFVDAMPLDKPRP